MTAAEDELRVTFPRSYRIFLSNFGAALCRGFEIAGIPQLPPPAETPPLHTHVVDQTKRFRNAHVPLGLILISHDGCDATFCLDTSRQTDGGEAPVIVWGPVSDHGQVLATHFLQFLQLAISGGI